MSPADYLRSQGREVSKFGEHVAAVVAGTYGGIYHIRSAMMADWNNSHLVEFSAPDHGFGTYDDSKLTKLVILAHLYDVKVEIKASTHGYLKLRFIKVDRNGFFADRHPNTSELISRIESVYKASTPETYFEIIGGYTGLVIGHCLGETIGDVKSEEPKARFRQITKEQYLGAINNKE